MTYGEIEFLPEPELPGVEATRAKVSGAGNGSPNRLALLAAAVGWLTAAVLAVIAPFHTNYRLDESAPHAQDGADFSFSFRIDGWGRLRVSTPPPPPGHSARFGIALCICAALFVLLAALCVQLYRRHRDDRSMTVRAAVAVGIAAVALLAGTLGSIVLDTQAIMSTYAGADNSDPQQFSLHARYGAFIWVCATSLVCAILAAGAQFLALRTAPPAEPEPPAAEPAVILDPEVDVLG